jgi:tetratricopeptide (TPR) repeat protein
LDKQFIQIFKKVISDYGLDICDDIKKLNSLLSDYSKGEYYKERRLAVWILEANKNNILKMDMEYDVWKNQCITNLFQNEFIDKERAGWAIDIIFKLIFGYKYYVDRGFYLTDKNKLKEANLTFDNAIDLLPYSSDAYHGKGIIALKDKDLDKTIEYFNKAIIYDQNKLNIVSSSLSTAYFERGNIFLNKKNFDYAIYDLNQSLKYSENINTYKCLAQCYHEISDYKNEEIELKNALALENNNIDLLINHAKVCLQLKNYNDSIIDYTAILNIDNTRIDIYELRSQVYYKINNFNDAINDNNTILKIEPDNSAALYHLGLIYYTTNDFTKAQEYLNQTKDANINSTIIADKIHLLQDKINIKNAEIFEEKGDKYFDNKKVNEAIEAYSNAINFTPNQSRLYFKRGYLYISESNHTHAASDLSEILDYSSEEYEILFANGFICYYKNEYNKSLDNFLNLLKLKPSFSDYLNSYLAELNIKLGQELVKNKNYEEAIKFFEAVIKYDNSLYEKNKPLIADIYFKIADNLFSKNDFKTAIKNYELSFSLINDNSIYFKLARCYHALSNYELEFEIYDNLKLIDPNNIEIYIRRSETYFILKEYNKALDDYNIILKSDKNNIGIHFKCLNIYILQNDSTSAQIVFDDILEIEPNNEKALYIKQIIDRNNSNFSSLMHRRKEWERQTGYISAFLYLPKVINDFGCLNCMYLHVFNICKKMEDYNAWPFTKYKSHCLEYKKSSPSPAFIFSDDDDISDKEKEEKFPQGKIEQPNLDIDDDSRNVITKNALEEIQKKEEKLNFEYNNINNNANFSDDDDISDDEDFEDEDDYEDEDDDMDDDDEEDDYEDEDDYDDDEEEWDEDDE